MAFLREWRSRCIAYLGEGFDFREHAHDLASKTIVRDVNARHVARNNSVPRCVHNAVKIFPGSDR